MSRSVNETSTGNLCMLLVNVCHSENSNSHLYDQSYCARTGESLQIHPLSFSNLPVNADCTKVEYGGSAQHHVHGHQAITYGHVQGPNSILELKQRRAMSLFLSLSLFLVSNTLMLMHSLFFQSLHPYPVLLYLAGREQKGRV